MNFQSFNEHSIRTAKKTEFDKKKPTAIQWAVGICQVVNKEDVLS